MHRGVRRARQLELARGFEGDRFGVAAQRDDLALGVLPLFVPPALAGQPRQYAAHASRAVEGQGAQVAGEQAELFGLGADAELLARRLGFAEKGEQVVEVADGLGRVVLGGQGGLRGSSTRATRRGVGATAA
jgi:hypothetical protein